MFQDYKGDIKVMHSELNDELYALVISSLHRNIRVHEFFKLALIAIDQFRNSDLILATDFSIRLQNI